MNTKLNGVMRQLVAGSVALVLAAAVGRTQAQAVTKPEALAQLGQLAWLSGCWQADGGEAGSVEHWLPLAGNTLLGVSRTVRGGKTVAHEFLQIRIGDDGRLAYLAAPSAQAPARFPLLRLSADEVVFEHLPHDFPQRIIYRQDAPDHLRARIEGLSRGAVKGIDYPLSRVACDAAPANPTR